MKDIFKTGLHFISVAVMNNFLLFYLKYSQNGMSIGEFNLYNLGNVINILIFTLMIGLFLINLVFNKRLELSTVKAVLFILYISLINLIIVFIVQNLKLEIFKQYFFSYPFDKVLITLNYFCSAFLQVYLIIFLFINLFRESFFNYTRAFFYSGLTVCVFLFLSLIYNTFALNYINGDDSGDRSLAIVLGAAVYRDNNPSPILKGRIEKAFQLFKDKSISKIHLTGGNAPGEISEGKCAYNYLAKKGVSEKYLLLEERTKTTSEQIRFIKNNLAGSSEFDNIIVISDDFHLVRIIEMSKFYNIKVNCTPSDYDLNWEKELFYKLRDSVGLLLFWFFAI